MSTTVQHSPAPHRRRSLSRASTGEPIPITGGPPLSASAVRAHDRLGSSQRSSSGLPSPNHPQNLPLGMSPGHRRQGSNGSNRGGSAPHPSGMVPHFSAATPQRADSARRPPPAAHPAPSLTLSQQALYFPLPLTRNIENVVDIVNTETHDVFFKVKSSTPTRYVTKPRIGVLKAGEELRMRVTLFASSAAVHGKLPDESSNDRFHFEARFVESGDDVANPASVWKLRKDAPGLARVILPCVFKAGDIPDSFVVCNSVPNTPSSARNSVSETPASAITQRSAAPGATPTPARGPLFPAGSSQARADSEAPLLQDPPSRLPRNPAPAVPHDRSAPHRHSSSTLDTPPLAPKAGTAPPTPEGSPINPTSATNGAARATTNGAAPSAAAAMPETKSAPVAARPPPYTPRPKVKKQGLLMRLLLASLPTVIVVPAMFLALWFGITAHTDPFRTAPLLLG